MAMRMLRYRIVNSAACLSLILLLGGVRSSAEAPVPAKTGEALPVQLVPPKALFERVLSQHRPDVLIIGDSDHSNTRLKAFYGELLPMIHQADSEFDCLFLEAGSEFQSDIDYFMATGDNAGFLERRAETLRRVNQNLGRRDSLLEVRTPVATDILAPAKSAAFSVFSMDFPRTGPTGRRLRELRLRMEPPGPDSTNEFVQEVYQRRNRRFAEVIGEKTNGTGKSCRKSVVLVGGAHLFAAPQERHRPSYSGPDLVPLQALLREAGLKSNYLLAADLQCDHPESPFDRKICQHEFFSDPGVRSGAIIEHGFTRYGYGYLFVR